MAKNLSDVTVKLNVEQPSVPVNMGNLAIFVKGESAKVETFSSYDDVISVHSDNDAINQVASGYFAQGDHGDKLFIITYDKLDSAAETFYGEGWEFATVVGADGSNHDEEIAALSNYINGKDERFAVTAYPATDTTVTKAEEIRSNLGNSRRTIVFANGDTQSQAFYGVGALIGAVANEVVGSVTWKFRKMGGVKPVGLNVTQIEKLHAANILTYVTKAGANQTSEGKTIGGEFIDALHGDDWVKASIETELQKLLSSSKKLTFDATGIAQIDAVVTNVLSQATRNGIIIENTETGMGKFTVTTASREDSATADISSRHYTGLSFSYTRAGAIHSVTVSGQINL
ncbi:DUF3383 family protein [Ligilactobacillus agilis]|uniref:DUF3383 family protein n=1 Tax=Ligilactobacillus agilis TaxID=1601 RepID=UPI0019583FB9|nr:DUF3383 family protein [Ligilactobacillus agilis]MBM6763623.1 DUF3383 family protein [Ligilactobacillus agilis]